MRSEYAYLADILDACDTIDNHLTGHTRESFDESRIVRDAVHYQLMIIGEAAGYLSEATQTQMPEIPWPSIRRMRNVLIHDYLHVDANIVWETAVGHIPILAAAVRRVLPEQD